MDGQNDGLEHSGLTEDTTGEESEKQGEFAEQRGDESSKSREGREWAQFADLRTGRLEPGLEGTLEDWNTGTLEDWNTGRLEHWNTGTLEHWKTGRLEDWNTADGREDSNSLEKLDSRKT